MNGRRGMGRNEGNDKKKTRKETARKGNERKGRTEGNEGKKQRKEGRNEGTEEEARKEGGQEQRRKTANVEGREGGKQGNREG